MTHVATALALSYGQHARQTVDVFVPDAAGRASDTALVALVPGSWWADGRTGGLRATALFLAERGLTCAILGHRPLGDGARSGADVLDDLAAAVTAATDEAGVLGWRGRSLAVLGSGSGSLCALVLAARSERPVRAAVVAGATPSLDPGSVAAAHQSACDRFAAGHHRDLSPLRLDALRLPPTLVLHGDADREVPAAQAQALVAHLGEDARLSILAGAGHQFIEDPLAATGRSALDQAVAWLGEHAREPEDLQLFGGRSL